MAAYDAAVWETFALGHLGAAGVLLGLVFVALAGNLGEVLASGSLVNRAFEAVVQLTAVLVAATFVLLPTQGRRALGIELLVVGLGLLVVVALLQRGARRPPAAIAPTWVPAAALAVRRLLGLGAPAAVCIAGASMVVGSGGGLRWWAASVLLGYGSGFLAAWVLLVEVRR